MNDVFKTAEDVTKKGAPKKAFWTGVVSLNLPELQVSNVEYHLKAAKADAELSGDHGIYYIDKTTGRRVESKKVNICYQAEKELSIDDMIAQNLTVKYEQRYFDSESLNQSPSVLKHIPSANVVMVQNNEDGVPEETSGFEATKRIEIGRIIPMNRLAEFSVESMYMLGPNLKEKETTRRVNELAKQLLANKVALYGEGFSFRAGKTVHDIVVFAHKLEEDDKTWLLMATTQGHLKLDLNWAIDSHDDNPVSVPVAKKAKIIRK